MNEASEQPKVCDECGAPIPAGAPMGICPRCLAAEACASVPDADSGGDNAPFQPPAPEELDRLIPEIEITSLIGQGGMGAVYRGLQTDLDREVAVKVLPTELTTSDPAFGERFRREARAMANAGQIKARI